MPAYGSALRGLCAFALLGSVACGLQPVELAATGGDEAGEVVVGDVPAAALAQLRAHRGELGGEALELIYPATPELVVPADLAPIGFEWRSTSKSKAEPSPKAPAAMSMTMTMTMAMPEPPLPPVAGEVAPPPEAMKDPKPEKKAARADDDPILAYELRASSAFAELRLYVAAEAASFPRDRWGALLRSHSGEALQLSLRGVRQSGAFVHAPQLELQVRAALAAGHFYSFSTTAQGITRAQLSDTQELVLREPAPLAKRASGCTGCHSLSRDGRRMLVAVADEPTLIGVSWVSDVSLRLDLADAGEGRYVFGSFDPTAARVAATNAGRLLIFDADTGQLLQQSAAPLEASFAAPDWSPDGRSIVVVTPRDAETTDAGALATLKVALDGNLSAPETLVNGPDDSLRAPCYSPDGEWIAYEKRMGPGPEGKDSKLFLVHASGGEPIELRGLTAGARPMHSASAPAFVPGDRPEQVYLLFSSRRAVGRFMPAEGQRQLFAAALDLSLTAAGEDPSHAAFWLPFQQRSSSYLRVQWSPALASCTARSEVCDAVDDDCDGVIDEDCCVPAPESCEDERDNDCDGAADEGCGCAFTETCDNLSDDDCDRRVDEEPCMPAPAER